MSYPYQFPVYQPAMRLITSITRANPAVVTTSPDHQYVTGTIVRLHVYPANGMVQANSLTGAITVLSNNTFSIPINSIMFDTFVVPGSPTANNTQACVVPIGEVTDILTAATNNVLPY